jgi:hypothetical protein
VAVATDFQDDAMSSSLLLLLLTTGGALSAVDTVVVCHDSLRPAMQPWVEYRQSQGHEIRFVPPQSTANATRDGVLAVQRTEPVRFVVLVGDTTAADQYAVPTFSLPGKVNIHWGPEQELASDSGYAQADDDEVPDLAVGRLTVDTSEQLATIVRKIIAYEQCSNEAGWRRKVNFVAGVGGFGAVADTILELSAKRLITSGIPAGYATTMTHASWRSPYCPTPDRFSATVLERLNEGCLFWVYVGHGQKRYLDQLYTPPNRAYDILNCDDVPAMQCQHGAPIALFLSCYAGAFDADEDCLAEEMLCAPLGPVAVAGSSRVAMPYGMCVLGTNLLKTCFQDRAETLGELFLAANRRTLTEKRDQPEAKMLDALAERLNPAGTSAAEERRETTQVFNLLGDPLLRISHPSALPITVPQKATAGEQIKIVGRAPFDGRCTVELVVRRDRLTFRAPKRPEYDASREAECHVRAFIDGREQFALGAQDLEIVRPVAEKAAARTDYSPKANSVILRK